MDLLLQIFENLVIIERAAGIFSLIILSVIFSDSSLLPTVLIHVFVADEDFATHTALPSSVPKNIGLHITGFASLQLKSSAFKGGGNCSVPSCLVMSSLVFTAEHFCVPEIGKPP